MDFTGITSTPIAATASLFPMARSAIWSRWPTSSRTRSRHQLRRRVAAQSHFTRFFGGLELLQPQLLPADLAGSNLASQRALSLAGPAAACAAAAFAVSAGVESFAGGNGAAAGSRSFPPLRRGVGGGEGVRANHLCHIDRRDGGERGKRISARRGSIACRGAAAGRQLRSGDRLELLRCDLKLRRDAAERIANRHDQFLDRASVRIDRRGCAAELCAGGRKRAVVSNAIVRRRRLHRQHVARAIDAVICDRSAAEAVAAASPCDLPGALFRDSRRRAGRRLAWSRRAITRASATR